MARYDVFREIERLTEMVETDRGYAKMIQAGELGKWDYNKGFFDLSISRVFQPKENAWWVRIWLGTWDDGDFGAWKRVSDETIAKIEVKQIADEVFREMLIFPTEEELNILLRPHGIYMCDE